MIAGDFLVRCRENNNLITGTTVSVETPETLWPNRQFGSP